MEKTTFIYTLSDPRTPDNIRYVGKTIRSINDRLVKHVSESKKGARHHRACWIRCLVKDNMIPVLNILDKVNSDWEFWEQHYISLYKFWGFNLVNGSMGGEGRLGYRHSAITKQKISQKKIGQPSPNKGKTFSEEIKQKQSKARKGMHSGEKHPNVILKENDVINIRNEYKQNKITQEELAKKYNVTRACISNMLQKRTWKHL